MKVVLLSMLLSLSSLCPAPSVPGLGTGGEGGWINVPGGGGGGSVRLYVLRVMMCANSPYLLAMDATGSRVDLVDPNLLTEVQYALSPQILKSEWKDRMGITHSVATNCANITIQECNRRHNAAVQALLNLYPANP